MKNERGFSRGAQWMWVGVTGLALLGASGCKSSSSADAPIVVGSDGATAPNGPADGGLAPVSSTTPPTQVLGQSASYTPTQQGESYAPQSTAAYPQQPNAAPIVDEYNDQAPNNQGYSNQDNQGYSNQPQYGQYSGDDSYNAVDPNQQAGEDGLSAGDIQTDQPPPPLPEYDQPPAPEPDYLWTPGYWAWGPGGYYWVPGVWCPPPYYGALWTPPYWGWYGNHYWFHHGYWGPHVGFYGGIDYGFGYIGIGYFGGYWNHDHFFYNRSVTNVSRINNTYVYNRSVIYNNVHYGPNIINRVSYNGGPRGLRVAPRPAERVAMREMHTAPLRAQVAVRQQSAQNRSQFYAANHGRPAQVAMVRPLSSPRSIAQTPAAARDQMMRGPQPAQGFNRGAQPAQNQMRPGMQPGVSNQQRTGFNNVQPARGAENFNRGAQQPAINQQRPQQQFNRPQQPAINQQRPQEQFNRPAQPAFNQQRPQEQFNRPAPQEQRPQEQFNRPAPQMQRPSAPPHVEPHAEGHPRGR